MDLKIHADLDLLFCLHGTWLRPHLTKVAYGPLGASLVDTHAYPRRVSRHGATVGHLEAKSVIWFSMRIRPNKQ